MPLMPADSFRLRISDLLNAQCLAGLHLLLLLLPPHAPSGWKMAGFVMALLLPVALATVVFSWLPETSQDDAWVLRAACLFVLDVVFSVLVLFAFFAVLFFINPFLRG